MEPTEIYSILNSNTPACCNSAGSKSLRSTDIWLDNPYVYYTHAQCSMRVYPEGYVMCVHFELSDKTKRMKTENKSLLDWKSFKRILQRLSEIGVGILMFYLELIQMKKQSSKCNIVFKIELDSDKCSL